MFKGNKTPDKIPLLPYLNNIDSRLSSFSEDFLSLSPIFWHFSLKTKKVCLAHSKSFFEKSAYFFDEKYADFSTSI